MTLKEYLEQNSQEESKSADFDIPDIENIDIFSPDFASAADSFALSFGAEDFSMPGLDSPIPPQMHMDASSFTGTAMSLGVDPMSFALALLAEDSDDPDLTEIARKAQEMETPPELEQSSEEIDELDDILISDLF